VSAQAGAGRSPGRATALLLAVLGVMIPAAARAEAPVAPLPPTDKPGTVGRPGDPLAGRFGGAFALIAPDARPVTDSVLHGRFVLITFGYTHCPDVCPTDLATMGQAIDALGKRGDMVQPVFVTVDPARDTPDVLAAYASSFHPRLLALSGSEAQVAAAARAYKVHRRKVLTSPGQTQDYLVDHSSLMYLMGPDGGFVTLFPANTPVDRMVAALKTYLP
jgi:protein SCO1